MMEQLPEDNTGQGDSPAAIPAVSLGTTLREARERLGLSIADVANQTKLAPRQIEALEADDFQHLPEMTFVRGFVRSYAKILQLDAQPLLADIPQANASTVPLVPASVEVPFPNAYSLQRQNLIWLGAALLLAVLVVAFAVWHFTTPLEKPEVAQVETPVPLPAKMQIIPASPVLEASVTASPVAPAAQPALVAAQSPVPAAKPLAPLPRDTLLTAGGRPEALPQTQPPSVQTGVPPQTATLRLTFDEESWTEIRDKDDKILSSQVNPRGSELSLKGQAPFSLVIGHAASVRLYHRGKQVDLTPHTSASSEVARLTLE
ncbi:MAG TPA: RodZ domain-containing protein [Gallionella sp.]|nr:RodZ domain-containing protein [Gallionella sp.]